MMPSGISHILLSTYLDVIGRPCAISLMQNIQYFKFGSIAPDLPYGSAADSNIFDFDNDIAELFHFTNAGQAQALAPNLIPLRSLERARELARNHPDGHETAAFFWFFAGYASHVIADGVCHPFVMDKVGPYEGANKKAHRALEMGIDVLLCKHFTEGNGSPTDASEDTLEAKRKALQASYLGMDTTIKGFASLRHTDFILTEFQKLIRDAYGKNCPPHEIKGWVNGMARMMCFCGGEWPGWFRELKETEGLVFRKIEDLNGREDEYLLLQRPKEWPENFRRRAEVHFIRDCVSRYNALMTAFLDKAFDHVYTDGNAFTEADLPPFSLDTGRTVSDANNHDLDPIPWMNA